MESLKIVFWEGDIIVWTNLLKHYVHSLAQIITFNVIGKSNINSEDIQLFPVEDARYAQALYKDFLSTNVVALYLQYHKLYASRIDKNSLFLHLYFLHFYACNSVIKIFKGRELIHENTPLIKIKHENSIINYFKFLLQSNPTEEQTQQKNINEFAKNFIIDITDLELFYSSKSLNSNNLFILKNFTQEYVNKLESHMFFECGIASFSKTYTNIAMWSHYTKSHEGVALKFKLSENLSIPLYEVTGGNSTELHYNYVNHTFKKVNYGYSNIDLEINFFKNLGRSSSSKLMHWWYGLDDKVSNCAITLQNQELWHKQYWKYFETIATSKHKHWAYEKEFRLINSSFNNNTIVNYKFDNLDGIIFGIKTTLENKRKIIKIIKNKCKSLIEKVQNFVDNNIDIDYEAKLELIKLINTSPHSYIKFFIKHNCELTFLNPHSFHKYKCVLNELYHDPNFKNEANIQRREVFNFYQAYYCENTHKIKHRKLNIPLI